MNASKKCSMPQCYVVVRKLSLEEISRISISPFSISHKCGHCSKLAYYEPKCTSCSVSYHYKCALERKTCCGLNILPQENSFVKSSCPKCKQSVEFGPQCTECHSKFHSHCLTPFDQCCQRNLCELPRQHKCAKCKKEVDIGPKCPLCMSVYHLHCIREKLDCCGIKFTSDDVSNYKCGKCSRRVSLVSPMCQFCGEIYHKYCFNRLKNCCGKRTSLEMCFIPSFKYMMSYYDKFIKPRAVLRLEEVMVVSRTHTLHSVSRNKHKIQRAKKKTASSQTSALDTITIVDVKTELEPKEVDVPSSPPILERETSCSPEPSSFYAHQPESTVDFDDPLKNLFDFLYNMVRKFPPQLQTQVKVDLFRTVTEAEMNLHCNLLPNN